MKLLLGTDLRVGMVASVTWPVLSQMLANMAGVLEEQVLLLTCLPTPPVKNSILGTPPASVLWLYNTKSTGVLIGEK